MSPRGKLIALFQAAPELWIISQFTREKQSAEGPETARFGPLAHPIHRGTAPIRTQAHAPDAANAIAIH
jgi:hypothetical protein